MSKGEILVVDDEPDVADAIQSVLEHAGFVVVTANSAINGSRTMTALSLPVRCAAAQAIHQAIGGWSK